ncbi:DNA primase [Acetobacter cibinongensis]|uniref:DNA primase n=1 Tax=Acetobacter cibinongensis TaxID=146475 RepID=A0A0D6MZC2_9PROT|nr:DNA primase [Acetobacter cibinongensis]GAN59034.1 DNA primase [Acetobacter cibinongensis]GBQ19776.1 DNA primase [Acetobacter cibinongensis NRIC 0482]GEL58898.1 DNA primase [Acetobacter cibinongensis]
MAIEPGFLDELRARTPLASVIGRRVKLARSGRNWKGCCPFHGEKTPSFYVYDDHFHCFGCGVHGDVISFVMQMEGKSFPEAVEELAGSAGMEVPKDTRRTREEVAHSQSLEDVLEHTQQIWSQALYSPAGKAGLEYLTRRGLTRQTIEEFGLGWAADGRGALTEALAPKGITPQMMAEAGLMRIDEEGRPKGELFWGRVTFPIRDRKGRLVSFGGRILGDGQPKYLNGPETSLFSKRRLLFGLDKARAAVRAPRPKGVSPTDLIVVEGYMDVIALHQAGFRGAVAALGTALTPEQLEVLWQVDRAPILCFDGDTAGRRAAARAAEVALPLVKADHSLRLCLLPEGEDPDSLVRSKGAQVVGEMFATASPLSEMLFDLLTVGVSNPGPEERAALRHKLVEVAGLIPDKALASEYRSTLLDRFFETFRRKKSGAKGGALAPARSVVRDSGPVALNAMEERQRILLALLLRYPEVVPEVEDALCRLALPPAFAEVRDLLLDLSAEGMLPETGDALLSSLEGQDEEEVVQAVLTGGGLPLALEEKDTSLAVAIRTQWWHFYGLLNFSQFQQEVEQEVARFTVEGGDLAEWRRLQPRLEALARLKRGEMEEFEA